MNKVIEVEARVKYTVGICKDIRKIDLTVNLEFKEGWGRYHFTDDNNIQERVHTIFQAQAGYEVPLRNIQIKSTEIVKKSAKARVQLANRVAERELKLN